MAKKHLILNTLGNDPAEYQRIAFQNMSRDRRPPDMLYLFEIKIYEQNAKSIFEKLYSDARACSPYFERILIDWPI